MGDLPIIDIDDLKSSILRERQAVAEKIGAACRDTGFFYVTNHGISEDMQAATFQGATDLFALPLPEKQSIHISGSEYHRGWEPIGLQALDTEARPDLKEGFIMGADIGLDHPEVVKGTPHYGPNLWPDLPDFRQRMVAYYDAMLALAARIGRGIALSLQLPEDHFDDAGKDSMSILRLLRYPPHPDGADDKTFGCGAHTDWGFLTILAQDRAGGLEVRTTDGNWIEAPPIERAFVINIGDMTARWTNDLYKSTPHRVVNRGNMIRYSIPFFYDLNYHTRVECLPSCQSADNPPKYAPTTAGDHILEMYAKTYGAAA